MTTYRGDGLTALADPGRRSDGAVASEDPGGEPAVDPESVPAVGTLAA